MSQQSEMREALRNWLASINGSLDADQIKDDLPLISERILTSLQVTDLLLFIEYLRGYPVDVTEIKPSSFQDLNHICDTFLKGENTCA